MAKKLKLWTGTSSGRKYQNHSIYIAAYNQKHACELIQKATGSNITPHILRTYYHSGKWGDRMVDITPTEPCVYVIEGFHYNAKRMKSIVTGKHFGK